MEISIEPTAMKTIEQIESTDIIAYQEFMPYAWVAQASELVLDRVSLLQEIQEAV